MDGDSWRNGTVDHWAWYQVIRWAYLQFKNAHAAGSVREPEANIIPTQLHSNEQPIKSDDITKSRQAKGEIVLPDDVCHPRDPPGQMYLFQELPALFGFFVGDELSKDTIIRN